jgi:diguanylate cyclase (GGDEF)-like protein
MNPTTAELISYVDPRSLGITLSFAALLVAGVLQLTGQALRWRLPGLRWATAGVVSAAAGFLLNMLQGHIPVAVATMTGITLMVGGEAMMLVGVLRLRYKPVPWVFLTVISSLCLITGFWYGLAQPNPRIRIGVFSGLLGLLSWWLAWITVRERRPPLRAGMQLFALFATVFAALMTVRAILVGVLGIIPNSVSSSPVNTLVVLISGVSLIGAVVGLIYISIGDLLTRLQHQSQRDPLTELRNRQGLRERLAAEPDDRPLVAAMIDLDHFKRINDTHGHDMGDRIIQHLAHLLHTQENPSIIPFRMGGEEFLLLFLLPLDANILHELSAAHRVADGLRMAFAHTLRTAGMPETTLSAGMSGGTVKGIEIVLRHADKALYSAKTAGRDRVTAAQG